MASGMFAFAKESFIGGDLDWDAQNFKVTLIDAADYAVNLGTHDYYNDVGAPARVATSGNLASKTKTGGVADAADVTFTAVTGDPSEALILWRDSGVETTSQLVCYIDTGTGFPVTPNGGDITAQWDAAGIFSL
jgi:hypothetical protein